MNENIDQFFISLEMKIARVRNLVVVYVYFLISMLSPFICLLFVCLKV